MHSQGTAIASPWPWNVLKACSSNTCRPTVTRSSRSRPGSRPGPGSATGWRPSRTTASMRSCSPTRSVTNTLTGALWRCPHRCSPSFGRSRATVTGCSRPSRRPRPSCGRSWRPTTRHRRGCSPRWTARSPSPSLPTTRPRSSPRGFGRRGWRGSSGATATRAGSRRRCWPSGCGRTCSRAPPGTVAGKAHSAKTFAQLLGVMNEALADFDDAIASVVAEHPDARIFASFPGGPDPHGRPARRDR